MEKRHILICGDKHVGKSTIVTRLLEGCPVKKYGFITKMLPAGPDGFHSIYIHPAWEEISEWVFTDRNMIGTCDRKTHNIRLEAFNKIGADSILAAKHDGIIVMDELGFMESDAKVFTSAVLEALEGDIPVIATVKSRTDVEFLNKVRSSENATVYYITENNRDTLYDELLPIVRHTFFKESI